MKTRVSLIILILLCKICVAQNLVPNGDFEQFHGCPNNIAQLDSALFWVNPTTATPDYLNQCVVGPYASVPTNVGGYQFAHNGNAYAGIIPWVLTQANQREYIETPLNDTLLSNTCYHFEMYVNLGKNSRYSIDEMGVYFSDTLITGINVPYCLPFIPQINNVTGNYFDTLSWTLVSGNFTAQGGERYLTIGNFKDDANTDTLLVNNNANAWTYLYIDDVSLTPCPTGINESIENVSVNAFPNPFNDKLSIVTNENKPFEIILYDITYRKVFNEFFINATSINTGQLVKGIYIYEIRNNDRVIRKGKLVKE